MPQSQEYRGKGKVLRKQMEESSLSFNSDNKLLSQNQYVFLLLDVLYMGRQFQAPQMNANFCRCFYNSIS